MINGGSSIIKRHIKRTRNKKRRQGAKSIRRIRRNTSKR
jgi:hypothetical protein